MNPTLFQTSSLSASLSFCSDSIGSTLNVELVSALL